MAKSKPTKKANPAKKAVPAKKTKPSKKVKKNEAKEVVKQTTKKIAKKTPKKVTKKVAKKTIKKSVKKVLSKVSKKSPKKIVKNVLKKQKKSKSKTENIVAEENNKITKFKFKINGYGSELAWAELDEDQFKYWRSKYDNAEDEYDAQSELINHVRHGEGPQYGEPGYLGEYYNWHEDFEEYPFYEGSTVEIDLYGGKDGTEFIECIELPLTDKKINKSFFNGFIDKTPSKKKFKGGTVFAKTEDRGEYCIGEMELSEEDGDFSLENFELSIEKVQGYQYVSMISYNDLILDYEKADDPDNKGFDCWIIWE